MEIKINKDEKFKFIEGFNNKYLISNYGKVFNLKTLRFQKTNLNSSGYPRVELSIVKNKTRIRKQEFIHLLVVKYFGDCKGQIINDSLDSINIMQVDHIDKNIMNYSQKNLQLVTNKENIRRKYIDENERKDLIENAKQSFINLAEIF